MKITQQVAAVAAIVMAASTIPVFAQTVAGSASSTLKKSGSTAIIRIIDRANQEIDRRIKNLTAVSTRISQANRLSVDQKNSIASALQAEISNLTTLKAKINTETDVAVLKTDAQSITTSYRIYALVMPRTAIIAAADRVMTIADMMASLGAKLQTRITDAGGAGGDIAALQAKLTDFNAKVADAKVQADAAVSLVINLVPDNGDKTKMAANTQAMKDARKKIQAAHADIVAARKDAGDMVKALRGLGKTNASSTTDQIKN